MTENRSDSATGLVSLVVPAMDEEAVLDEVVRELADRPPFPVEFILVVNGSRNGTPEVARRLARDLPGVRALIHPGRLGKGGAILEGFRDAAGDVIGFQDADGPFAPADLWSLAQRVGAGGADCAISSKWLGQRYREVTSYGAAGKRLFSRGLNLITRTAFGLPFADTQGGAKFLTRRALAAIGGDFRCRGYDFDVELLFRLARAGLRIEERFLPCRKKTTLFRDLPMGRMLLRLARLRLSPPPRPRA